MNPWAFPPKCAACNDATWVAADHNRRRSNMKACPICSDPVVKDKLTGEWLRRYSPTPTIRVGDLDENETKRLNLFKQEGYSEWDGLRWIEGSRYDPLYDEEFLKEAREEFRKWRGRV